MADVAAGRKAPLGDALQGARGLRLGERIGPEGDPVAARSIALTRAPCAACRASLGQMAAPASRRRAANPARHLCTWKASAAIHLGCRQPASPTGYSRGDVTMTAELRPFHRRQARQGHVGPLRRRLPADDRRGARQGAAGLQGRGGRRRRERQGRAAGLGRHQPAAPRPRADEVPRARRRATTTSWPTASPASTARPSPTPRATSSAASRWSSSPAASRIS